LWNSLAKFTIVPSVMVSSIVRFVSRGADEAGQRDGVGDLGVQLVDHRPEERLLVADPGEVAAVVVVPDSFDFVLKIPAAHQGESLMPLTT